VRSVSLADLESLVLFYIFLEASFLVGYSVRVLVGLHNSNVTRIIYGES
jgi:hypothetical protein